jgi:phosphate transport system substrate-binding protein
MDSLTRSLLSCVIKRQGRHLPAGGAFLISLMLFVLLSGCTQPGGSASDLNGHLLVAGSTALQPLATAAASLFQQQHAHVHVEV